MLRTCSFSQQAGSLEGLREVLDAVQLQASDSVRFSQAVIRRRRDDLSLA
jgi:hypothetical protein